MSAADPNADDTANEIYRRAYAIASDRRHELVTLEHLLMAMIELDEVKNLILAVGGDLGRLDKDVKGYVDDPANHVIVRSGVYQPRHTALLLTVAKKAKTQSMFSGRPGVGSIDLLLSMFNIENSHASYFLFSAGIEKDAVISHINQKTAKSGEEMAEKDAIAILTQYCINLNDRAREGKIDPLIGREAEVENITKTMARRRKNNVVLIGEPGVGKTGIVEGLAKRIVDHDVPDTLADKVIWSLDISSLLAGTKFRGDFEERMKQVISAFSVLPTSILFIDEIHMIMGAGSSSNGSVDAANLLKPALSRGQLRCIGSTTLDEYRKHFEKDRALGRRFQKIDVHEPSIADSKRILAALAPYYAEHHGIEYQPAALDAAVELSVRFLHGLHLPDKAIDLIDGAGAKQAIKALHDRAESIGVQQIKEEISAITQIPMDANPEDEDATLDSLESDLKGAVFGQDEAVERVNDAVLISKSGLRESNKTLGSFLFTGPTGVGKTELAKKLAACLKIPFVRFDMSEFQEKHTVSRFIGSPPGYVGYSDGQAGNGMLINTLDTTPHCVMLCDEVEKAHADVFNIFLQIMDHGTVTSASGKTANARNIYLIFTSNLGAAAMEKNSIGFNAGDSSDEGHNAVKNWFAPEFRNRLDAVVHFNRLNKENMGRVLDKFISELNDLTTAKKVSVTFDPAAKTWLTDRGFDRNMGARPMARTIQEHVKKPLSREMLFGRLKTGGAVVFTVKDSKLVFEVLETPPAVDNLAEIAETFEGVTI